MSTFTVIIYSLKYSQLWYFSLNKLYVKFNKHNLGKLLRLSHNHETYHDNAGKILWLTFTTLRNSILTYWLYLNVFINI
ncbi:hypothetical protein E2704_04755 [Salmonella enterica]|uniref:Uncharacterized protein n=2 Tax=Salmonella enterica TaxID=28901 RepID=A0A3J4P1J3_SALER|nr:hypothetical protein LFZ50_05315 [Salmonella enterica subsp. arizonae serovar 53:-:- str. SA20100345]AXC78071.1 hypothetical protein DOE56_16830 [Salmonella enterica subsp. arizonae serovar 63:g,z51:-]EAA5367702.1 hypothetical protein [Salmonella enterica subsp. arizonae]EAA7633100.1 hypothetical protein [Salmonella enterica]EAN8390883.1 hypothetical protein [Salmonella enterica subsp. arizonae serovar 13,23:gz51:-]EAN8610713.1 hypothetical protein [Salmonella enterica subsp. arizonae serov